MKSLFVYTDSPLFHFLMPYRRNTELVQFYLKIKSLKDAFKPVAVKLRDHF